MRPGDKVKVYQRPLTEEEFEGVATLVEHVDEDRWAVRFEDEPETRERFVY